jgi:hypothetical protein
MPIRAPAAPIIAENLQESARDTSLGGLMPRLLDVSFERELCQLVRVSPRSIGQYLGRERRPFIAATQEDQKVGLAFNLIYDIECAHSIENRWTAVVDPMADDASQLRGQPSHRMKIGQV